MAVRRIVVDPDLEDALGPQPEGVEVGVGGSLEPTPFESHEVLVVSADPERLEEAGRQGLHRIVAGDAPATTAEAVAELVAFLDRA
jgi:hypothetical protein